MFLSHALLGTLITSLLNLISDQINRLNLLSLCFNLSRQEFTAPSALLSFLNEWHEESTYWAWKSRTLQSAVLSLRTLGFFS